MFYLSNTSPIALSYIVLKSDTLPKTSSSTIITPSALTLPTAQHGTLEMFKQLPLLKGAQVHTSVMLSEVDRKILKKLGIDFTSEPIAKKSTI